MEVKEIFSSYLKMKYLEEVGNILNIKLLRE